MTHRLDTLLEPYGVPETGIVDLACGPTPDAIRYLDLVAAGGEDGRRPDGVVETQNEPLAYVLDATRRPAGPELPHLRRTLALRGDAPYLAVVEPGRLTLYGVSLDRLKPERARLDTIPAEGAGARTTFYRLHVAPSAEERHGKFVHDVLFRLLTETVDGLQEHRVDRDDAISLAGRALFLRFLVDRRILAEEDWRRIHLGASRVEELFSSPTAAASTCWWLDDTFNGDFLPLSFGSGGFKALPEEAFARLSDILHRSPGGQRRFDWGDLDFAHVPVGLLSQVYEQQAERWDPSGQREKSVYYTPRRIAEYMVGEVFARLEEEGSIPPHEARVLDPAVGGAVFLVAAFQEIVAAWWRRHGHPPDTRRIRSMLYRQLTGFDVSEPALRLAALSLYLKAIELDLDPHPVQKLRFEPLRGRVLHDVRRPGEVGARFVLGSLGAGPRGRHRGVYDVVVGNPPWTSFEGEDGRAVHASMVEVVRPIVQGRLGDEQGKSFQVPDLAPDLLFVWQAMEWARPGGWLAFALHGRLLFKASDAGRRARADLFQAVAVAGVLNGADLRKTEVWPRVAAPFCLLFATNELPSEEVPFYFVSPHLEESLNRQGRLRVDALAAHPISVGRLVEQPDLLKVLFRGNALDAGILRRIEERGWPTLEELWRGNDLNQGQGYQVARKTRPAEFLLGLPDLTAESEVRFLVEPTGLPEFNHRRLQWPRRAEIYRAPLLLVRKSPPADRRKARAHVCFQDLAFSESFYGYSAHGHPEGDRLIRVLLLLVHSELFLWHTLVTSGELGVERESIQKLDVDRLPVPPLESLDESLKQEADALFEQLVTEKPDVWPKLDDWTARLYGLDSWDQEVIRDTLEVGLPFPESRTRAQVAPTRDEVDRFIVRLQEELRPFARTAGRPLAIRRVEGYEASPWEILLLEDGSRNRPTPAAELTDLTSLLRRADEQGASQLVVSDPGGRRLLIAVLRQYRYWTPTRARLCALELLEEHLGTLTDDARTADS